MSLLDDIIESVNEDKPIEAEMPEQKPEQKEGPKRMHDYHPDFVKIHGKT